MQSKLKQKTRLLHLLIEFNCCMVDSKLWWTPGRILLDYDWFWPGLSWFFLGFGCSIVNVFNISHYFGVRKARNRIAIEISFDLIISKNTELLKFVLFKYAGKNVTLGFSTDLRRTKLRHCILFGQSLCISDKKDKMSCYWKTYYWYLPLFRKWKKHKWN